jgi:hypothetical protein
MHMIRKGQMNCPEGKTMSAALQLDLQLSDATHSARLHYCDRTTKAPN